MDYNNYLIKQGKYLWREIEEQHKICSIPIELIACDIVPDLRKYIFTVRPAEKTRINQVLGRAEDIQSVLGLPLYYAYKDGINIRIVVSEHDDKHNIKKKSRVLKTLRSQQFINSEMKIPFAIGFDHVGNIYIVDLAEMTHLVIVGPSGSGKSVSIKCLILSIIVSLPVTAARLIVFEMGAESLSEFNDALHLYHPIVKDVEKGLIVLESLIAEMEERLAVGEKACEDLPYIICIIEEFDDTISNVKSTEIAPRYIKALNSLIRRARKAKIILVLASHNPTLKTTGIYVNGIDSRICFRVLNRHDSSTGIGIPGADKLPGDGALILKTPGKVEHLQGSWVADEEINKILSSKPEGYDDIDMLDTAIPEATTPLPVDYEAVNRGIAVESENKELARIVIGVLGCEKISAIKIGKLFGISDKQSRKVMEILDEMKLLGEKNVTQPRKVISTCYEDLSEEVISFLNRYGYTEEHIREAFYARALLQQPEAHAQSSTNETEHRIACLHHGGGDSNGSI